VSAHRRRAAQAARAELLALGAERGALMRVRGARERLGVLARTLKHLLADPSARKND